MPCPTPNYEDGRRGGEYTDVKRTNAKKHTRKQQINNNGGSL
jgi:hypothetical protein